MKKKVLIIASSILFLFTLKFCVGIFKHDEFGYNVVFIKHRPIWKTYFYSPRGMRDWELNDMPAEIKHEQVMFDEFVLENQTIE